jgi:hypothetical protein
MRQTWAATTQRAGCAQIETERSIGTASKLDTCGKLLGTTRPAVGCRWLSARAVIVRRASAGRDAMGSDVQAFVASIGGSYIRHNDGAMVLHAAYMQVLQSGLQQNLQGAGQRSASFSGRTDEYHCTEDRILLQHCRGPASCFTPPPSGYALG